MDKSLDQSLQFAGQMLRPSLGTSVFKTFKFATGLVYFVSWLLCLPIELILHRRVGKRYQNTVVYVGALFAMVLAMGFMLRGSLSPAAQRAMQNGSLPVQDESMEAAVASTRPFNALFTASLLAFLCHWCGNRRRFGGPDQGHSCDAGVPWIVYPPFSKRLAVASGRLRMGLRSRRHPESEFDAASRSGPEQTRATATLREIMAYPLAAFRQIGSHLRHHDQMLASGRPPYGPLTWFALAIVEPILLAAVGMRLQSEESLALFGTYLVVVGAAMFLKGRIIQADWRERAYDETDQRIEAEAMRSWRHGSPESPVSRVFTVPITRAAQPARPSPRSSEPVAALPGFEYLFAHDAGQPASPAPATPA